MELLQTSCLRKELEALARKNFVLKAVGEFLPEDRDGLKKACIDLRGKMRMTSEERFQHVKADFKMRYFLQARKWAWYRFLRNGSDSVWSMAGREAMDRRLMAERSN